jgi:hypothetical protein
VGKMAHLLYEVTWDARVLHELKHMTIPANTIGTMELLFIASHYRKAQLTIPLETENGVYIYEASF